MTTATFALSALLVVPEETLADGMLISPENPWIAMKFSTSPSQSQLLHDSRRLFELDRATFVITHGMGGTKTGNRFHLLRPVAHGSDGLGAFRSDVVVVNMDNTIGPISDRRIVG